MTEPIRIPVSVHQLTRFDEFRTQVEAAQLRFNDAVTAIIAGVTDPASLQDWSIQLVGSAIVCTPPAPATPVLVPDIGPDGVTESAATG